MKITIIGYWGAFPEKNEAASGYLIESGDYNILIDCGSGVLSVLQNYINLDDIDAVILSHYHNDHMSDIFCFQYQVMSSFMMEKRKKPLQIYAHGLDNKFESLKYEDMCIANKIDETTKLNFGDLNITFKWANHSVPSLCMRLEQKGKTLVYTGDTEWCDNIMDISKEADILLCECTLFNNQLGLVKGHLTAGETGRIASVSNIKKLVLTHFPHYGELEILVGEAKNEFKGEIIKAKQGMVLNL
ncbi:MBL fold metallo-hydrolase [Clostridium aestuarii]|uniref:MBL fold metallo-hydrolase n=1 Tax=Clostridium aestuarii TaxID=338193 RepID=A0ABT4D3N9_9CLOT|nr:MBL fold metallo-hydrolase [Clostridium aestuarii]MCY6485853.1 MBL fold metallo-hydrolase [Clostridium aestuarii]